jgi:hypothetical protein
LWNNNDNNINSNDSEVLKLWPKLPTYSEQHTLKLIARGLLPMTALAELRARLEQQQRLGVKNLRETFVMLVVGQIKGFTAHFLCDEIFLFCVYILITINLLISLFCFVFGILIKN